MRAIPLAGIFCAGITVEGEPRPIRDGRTIDDLDSTSPCQSGFSIRLAAE